MLAWIAFALTSSAASADIAAQRSRFIAAEARLAAGSAEAMGELLDGLDGYPLAPYLERDAIERDIGNIEDDPVETFLTHHPGLPGIGALRSRWVQELARRARWAAIVESYAGHRTSLSVAARCHLAQALAHTGRAGEAWQEVAQLWPTPRSLPDACDAVLASWRAAGGLTPERVWQRLLAAVPRKQPRLVRYLRKLLPSSGREHLDRWLALRRSGDGLVAAVPAMDLEHERDRRILLDVFTSHARRDPRRALALLESVLGKHELPDTQRVDIENIVGSALARGGYREAFAMLGEAHSSGALEARAELAIRRSDWKALLDSVAVMPPDAASHGRWRYWHGRAQQLLGQTETGARFDTLARERGYYAFLAADRLRRDYNMAPRAIEPEPQALRALEGEPAIARIEELMALRRASDGRREWSTLLARLDSAGQTVAARIASDRGWDALAIFAAGRAAAWDDLALRFPLTHRTLVTRAANDVGLSTARVFAIIRQESAFMVDARSSAGALGPMQLMPSTARLVARRLKQSRPSTHDLLEPPLNISLGSHYLAGLHDRYDAHPVLSAAAYNAGPGNVARWLPATRPLSSEVWIERIPFTETRGYVQRVLAYQAIYRFRLGAPQRRIANWMPQVPPG